MAGKRVVDDPSHLPLSGPLAGTGSDLLSRSNQSISNIQSKKALKKHHVTLVDCNPSKKPHPIPTPPSRPTPDNPYGP